MKKIFILLTTAILISCEKEEAIYEQFTIDVGGQFTIELEANWSTGHSWKWENSLDTSLIDTINRIYVQSDPGLGGGSGIEKWTFIGKRAGKGSIFFIYLKANNENQDPLETREYAVNVQSS